MEEYRTKLANAVRKGKAIEEEKHSLQQQLEGLQAQVRSVYMLSTI